MHERELYGLLLSLAAPWFVADMQLDTAMQQVDVFVEHARGTSFCWRECGKSCPVYDHTDERQWRHLDTMQFKTMLRERWACPDEATALTCVRVWYRRLIHPRLELLPGVRIRAERRPVYRRRQLADGRQSVLRRKPGPGDRVLLVICPAWPSLAEVPLVDLSFDPTVTPEPDVRGPFWPPCHQTAEGNGVIRKRQNPGKHLVSRGFARSGRLDSNQRPLRPERSALARLSYAPIRG